MSNVYSRRIYAFRNLYGVLRCCSPFNVADEFGTQSWDGVPSHRGNGARHVNAEMVPCSHDT